MFSSNVQPRIRRKPAPKPWRCDCKTDLNWPPLHRKRPAYLVRCPDCKKERPDG